MTYDMQFNGFYYAVSPCDAEKFFHHFDALGDPIFYELPPKGWQWKFKVVAYYYLWRLNRKALVCLLREKRHDATYYIITTPPSK